MPGLAIRIPAIEVIWCFCIASVFVIFADNQFTSTGWAIFMWLLPFITGAIVGRWIHYE